MSYISNELINEIRNKTDIVEVVSKYVNLTKTGKNYIGVCPFHDDHSPSMSVSPEKQIYTCFSCGATGNVFTFISDFEKISFIEAVKLVGEKVGIAVAGDITKNVKKDKYLEIYEYLNSREHRIPKLMFNIVNGGMHAKNNLDIQEFMIVPKRESFKEGLRCASEVFHALKKLLDNEGLTTSVGDEGGFAPNLKTNKTALNYIIKAIETAGYIPGKDVFIALDIAATSFYNEQTRTYKIEDKFMTKEELLDYYMDLVKNYPIISIEDPFAEFDYEGFKLITEKLGKEINIVGDDLFVTNKKELKHGIDNNLCNSILIKPNQIGTFYEMLETIVLAKKNNYTCIMSHRSGETTDTFIIDAAVALNIPFVKTGSVSRGERICKFNRLLKIEEELNEK